MKKVGFFVLLAAAFLLSACESLPEEPMEITRPIAETVEPSIPSDNEVAHTYSARLCTEDSSEFLTVDLYVGETINVPQRDGYLFQGYFSGEQIEYIDSDGIVTRDYYGADQLPLYSKFVSESYTVQFYDRSGLLEELPSLTAINEKNMFEFLPLGYILPEGKCITGLADEDGNVLVTPSDREVYLKDLESALDEDGKSIRLFAVTTNIEFKDSRYSTYIVTNKGFFKQSLNNKGAGYDEFDISKSIDIKALKELGYKSVEITLSCDIRDSSKRQHIQVLSQRPVTKQQQRLYDTKKLSSEYILLDSGKIKKDKLENEDYESTVKVPIERISECIYVYYNAEGIKAEWKSNGVTLNLRFIKDE